MSILYYILYIFLIYLGTLTPYKLGDVHRLGKIGFYPKGILTNFTYDEASPILFRVNCFMDILTLNSYPTHYISVDPSLGFEVEARIIEVKTNSPVGDPLSMTCVFDHNGKCISKTDEIMFHPDNTGRVILKTDESVDYYKIISGNNNSRICRQYTFEISPSNSEIVVQKSCLHVLSFAYNSELNIIGILIQRRKYPQIMSDYKSGVVNIYDNSSGEFLRTVKLKKKISDVCYYKLSINSYSIIVFESGVKRRQRFMHTVHVYMM